MDNQFLEALSLAPNPSYVLNEKTLIDNLKLLNKVQNLTGAKVLCALKGFSMWSTFPLVKEYLSGGTASSINEVRLIHEEMGIKAHSCFVVYEEQEFQEILAKSSHVTFNSMGQYNKYKSFIASHPEIQFLLRVNPEYSAIGVDKYNPCMPGSRFGILSGELEKGLPEGISGIHFHALCENGSAELETVLENVESKFGHLLHQCKVLNIGGGHHITKDGYDLNLLVDLLNNLHQNYGLQVIVEPGEAIGWQTGVLKSRVEDVVENTGISTAILNVSFSAHMPDCLEMPYKPDLLGEVDQGKSYTLGGNTCMSGDFVEGFHFKNELKVGDEIIFLDMMHYTFVKNNTFNGVPLPAIATVTSSGDLKVHKVFGYEDFKNRLS